MFPDQTGIGAVPLKRANVDPPGQRPDVLQQVARDLGHRARVDLELGNQLVQQLAAAQCPGRDAQVRVNFVQEPADLGLHRSASRDQAAPVVGQQLDLTRGPRQLGRGQIVLAQSDARDSLGIDRVGLARLAPRATHTGHQPGVDPDDLVPCIEQISLQTTGQVPAVLDRDKHVPELLEPAHDPSVPGGTGFDRECVDPLADLIDCDEGVPVLVGVDADDRHPRPSDLFNQGTAVLGEAGHASVGQDKQAGSYQATAPNSSASPAERHIAERPLGQRRNEPTPPDQDQSGTDAKKAEADFRISFARRSSAFSRLSRLISASSSLVTPGRSPASTCVRRTHRRNVSGEPIPSLPATCRIASYSVPYCGATSATIRTARSRSSGGSRDVP